MRKIVIFSLLFTGTTQVFAAESTQREEDPLGAAVLKAASDMVLPETVRKAGEVIVTTQASPNIPPYQLEKLKKLVKAMKDSSVETMPVDVFLIERAMWDTLKVNSAFWAKSGAKTVIGLFSYIPLLSGNFLMRSVSFPALSSYANMVTRGDSENFPTLTLKAFVDLLEQEKVIDRETFGALPTAKRSMEFETEEFNGVGKGYKGRLVFMDFVCGTPLETPGGVHGVISQYGDQVLDHLVSVKVNKTPIEWIQTYFADSSPAEFTKVGQVWKNTGLHTCTLYVLNVKSLSLYVLGMRIPEKEYLETVEWWKEVHRRHQAEPPSTVKIIEPGDAAKK